MREKLVQFKFERELNFIIRGEQTKGKLVIENAEWIEEKGKWACFWSISFINPEVSKMYGDDPLHAFTNTVDFLSSLIRGSEDDGLIVWWKKEGDHAGLTFPQVEGQNWTKMPEQ